MEADEPSYVTIGTDGHPELRDHPDWQTDENLQIQNRNEAVLEGRYGYNVINEPTADQLENIGYFDQYPRARGTVKKPGHEPDFIIEGRAFDNYVTAATTTDQLWYGLIEKVPDQTTRVVLDLAHSTLEVEQILTALNDPNWTVIPLDALEEVIIMQDGEILGLWARN